MHGRRLSTITLALVSWIIPLPLFAASGNPWQLCNHDSDCVYVREACMHNVVSRTGIRAYERSVAKAPLLYEGMCKHPAKDAPRYYFPGEEAGILGIIRCEAGYCKLVPPIASDGSGQKTAK